MLLFTPLIIIFIVLLRKIVIIRIFSVDSQRIGHFASNVDIYLNNLHDQKKKKYFDLCFYQSYVSNEFLGKLWKRKINVYPNLILFPIYTVLNYLSKKFVFLKHHLVKHSPGQDRDLKNFNNFKPSNIQLNFKEINFGKNKIKEFGISPQDKFVCLTVRDSLYLKKTFPKNNYERWKYRDYDIDLFNLACEEITKKGYYVFRMGKIVEKKINFKNKMVIDYPFSPHKSDFFDIYLLSNCEFCLTTDLGLDSIPFISRKPIASITDPISLLKLSSRKYLNIFSYYFHEKENRLLNLSEIFKLKLAFFDSYKDFESTNIKLIKPNQEDIKNLALDMIEYINNDFILNNEDLELNNKFLEQYSKLCNSDNFINLFNSHKNHKKKDNILKLHNVLHGRISPTYLKKNSYLYNNLQIT